MADLWKMHPRTPPPSLLSVCGDELLHARWANKKAYVRTLSRSHLLNTDNGVVAGRLAAPRHTLAPALTCWATVRYHQYRHRRRQVVGAQTSSSQAEHARSSTSSCAGWRRYDPPANMALSLLCGYGRNKTLRMQNYVCSSSTTIRLSTTLGPPQADMSKLQ